MKRNRPSGIQQRKIKKSKELARESLSGSILKYVAPSASLESNTSQLAVESDLLDETNDVERRCQNELDGGTLERKPDIQEERQRGEDQHQEEYDQEKGRNSDNEEESQQIVNDEEELHNTTRFDVGQHQCFFPIAGKTAVELTENILTQLEGDNLDIHLCRAQGYDNAATMAGVHGGVQAIIKEHNPKTLFMPCANHLLNLCGVHCFGSVSSSVTFFGTLERVYTFFSSSTHRWGILMKSVGVSVKRLVETRWSAHHDAVKSLKNNFEKLVSTLEDMCDLSSSRENADTREAASTLLPALCDFSFLCYLSFWCEVLEEVNQTQKYTQTPDYHWKSVSKNQSPKNFLLSQRINIVERAISYATEKCEDLDISIERRGRRRFRKRMPGEVARDAGLTLPEELQRAMLECLDRFYEELEHRYKAMDDILITFVVQPKTLLTSTEEELRDIVPNLTKIYDELCAEDIILRFYD
ncbi:hypothetical protein EVAR_25728_1 [Eumeta japonica]|uniref:Zinc finger MYM-type protein 1 n=1 Tax=Eumeta variegata TaxID=151549 RepID=A0A4C1V9Z9_EUMVA|nr:hypothetical protein EVAR_25728_1 [Eumeta japonica]